jgi:hypothetical protein
MGSFNTTCFVSQQIIATGDESVILPIIQQTTYRPVSLLVKTHEGIQEVEKYGYMHSTCYPTAFWGYYGPMIYGSYDDYGRFKLDDTDSNFFNLIHFFNELHKNVCDVKQGENSCHDHPMEFSKIYDPSKQYSFSDLVKIWEKIWDMAEQSRLFATDYKQNPCSIAFAVMHKITADYLINSISQSTSYDGTSLEQKTYFNSYINDNLKRVLELFKGKKEKQDIITFAAASMLSLDSFRIGQQEGTYINNFYDYPEEAMDKMIEYFKENPEATSMSKEATDDIFEYFEDQIKHRYLVAGLTKFDIRLSPMVYSSQDCHNEEGNAYLEMIKEINAKVNLLVKEKYGEDEEDEDEE